MSGTDGSKGSLWGMAFRQGGWDKVGIGYLRNKQDFIGWRGQGFGKTASKTTVSKKPPCIRSFSCGHIIWPLSTT